MNVYSVLVFTSLLAVSSCSHNLSETYRYSAQLNGKEYALYWNFDIQQQNISFAVRVNTTGWIGFGLSCNGQMAHSDLVIGWVDTNQQSHLQDRFIDERATPLIDANQNWFLTRGEEEDGYTILEFWRNFTTCDDRDCDIRSDVAETARIIWSYHPSDPSNPTGDFPNPTNRGSRSLNLVGRLQKERSVPSDAATFTIRNNNFLIPNNTDTTYWCSYHVHGIPPGEIYIYKATPILTSGYLHHMVLAVCPENADELITVDHECGAMLPDDLCYYGDALPGWTVGGEEFTFPEDVAHSVPVHTARRVVIIAHYNNPNLDSGVYDSSGMIYHYTRQRPRHVAGYLGLESTFFRMVIPPLAEQYNVTGLCSSNCTEEFFPEEGITIIAIYQHTHTIGRAHIARHGRRNDKCDAIEELRPIDDNELYSSSYQTYSILHEPVTVRKGDFISVTCTYDSKTSNRTRITQGGLSTRDENCVAFVEYYPKISLTYCGSFAEPQFAYEPFLRKHLPPQDATTAVKLLEAGNATGISEVYKNINWTLENIADFQNTVLSAKQQAGFCWNDHTHPDGGLFNVFPVTPPKFDCLYEKPNQCTGYEPKSCCERLQSTDTDAGLNIKAVLRVTVGSVIGGFVLLFMSM